MVSGAGSGSDSEVSNGDVVVGAVDSEGFGSEDAGFEDSGSGCAEVDVEDAEVGVDGSAAWVGSDVGSLVAELVAELEGSVVCFSVEAAVVVSAVVFSEVVFSEVDVLEVGRSDGSADEDAAEDGSADVVLFVDSVVWEGSADWEDEEVAVGALAATWGASAELEDGVEAGVVRDGAGAGAGAEATSLAAAMAAAPAAEAALEIAWESSPRWPPRGSLWWPRRLSEAGAWVWEWSA